MKRVFLFFALIGLSVCAKAQTVVTSGSCGTNVSYVLMDDSTFTIYGDGAMNNYTSSSRPPWYSAYRDRIKTLVIGDSVTTIGNYAFAASACLTSVSMGNSITTIGNFAFNSCSKLTSINIPNSVTSIGTDVFYICGFASIVLPDGITSIGDNTFHACALTSITIPTRVKTIGVASFRNCGNLNSITMGDSLTNIANQAFEGCSKLDTIICKATTPPTITNTNTFSNVPTTANVFVPCGTAEDYKAATQWKRFSNYIEMPFPTPINVSVTQVDNSFVVAWEGGAESYEVYRDNVLLETVTTTTYTDTDLEEEKEYCYQIKAVNGDCESVLSEDVCETLDNTGIVSATLNNLLRVYPNPTTGQLTIACRDAACHVPTV